MLVKQKVKYIQSLGQKKFREQEGLYIAEGPKLVKDLLEADPGSILEIYATEGWLEDNKHLTGRDNVFVIPDIELERISQLATPNKVLAIVNQYHRKEPIITKDRITLLLDTIQDPGNFGTIIRIADWFGVSQVVASHDSADLYNPKVVQATMGSIARVPVYYKELVEWLSELDNMPIYAAALEGRDINTVEKITEAVLIIGNESKGISPGLLAKANNKVTIKRKGKAESLNAAVATGIILSHIT